MRVNLKRYWLGALLLASLSLLLFGCGDFGSSQNNVATKTISGVVSNATTGMPASGVQVEAFALGADGSTTPLSINPAKVTSGSDGSYSLRIPANYQGAVLVQGTASVAKRAKQLFATTVGGNTTILRAVVPASLLADGPLPPVMLSLATEALYQYVNVNSMAGNGGFTDSNLRAATLILENFFGPNFSTTPPPASATDLATSKEQQDLLVTISAIATLDGDLPALVLKMTAPLGTLAGDIKNSIQTVTVTLKAQGSLPGEYVPSATIITGISNAQTTALQADPALVADTTAPAAPTGLTAPTATVGARQVVLNWSAVADADLDGYVICRADQSNVFVSVGSVAADTTTFTDLNVAPQSHYSYKVIAFDRSRNFSPESNIVQVVTLTSLDTVAPAAPTNLVRVAFSATQNNLQWKQAMKTAADGTQIPASRYYVYRDAQLVTPAGVTGTTFADTGLEPLTQYTYYVKAADANGNLSGASNTLTVRTASAATDPAPAFVAGLIQDPSAPATATGVTLKWNTVTGTDVTYNVYQDGVLIASGLLPAANATTMSFTDGSVFPNSTYSYQVSYTFTTTSGARLESQLSDALNVTTPAGTGGATTAPSIPTNLRAGTPTSNSVPLTWTASTPAAGDSFVIYEIYRKNMGNGDTLKIATVVFPAGAGVQPAYVDTAVVSGSVYAYWLKAVSSGGVRSAASDVFVALQIPASTPLNNNKPGAPTLATPADSDVTSFSVKLTWTAPADTDIAGYFVFRNGLQIAQVTGTTYTDTAVVGSTAYQYSVAAVNTSGLVSDPSNTVSVTTAAANGFYLFGKVTINGDGLAGITVTATSATDQSTTTAVTDANGSYVIAGLANNTSYTLVCTPGSTGTYVFTPASKTVAIRSANVSGLDFIAMIPGVVTGGVTYPDGTIIGGITYPPGSVIGGVTYPTGATVINGVVYPTGTVIGGVTYPNGVVIGGVTYPAGTIVGGIAFPVGFVVTGVTYPTGTIIGGVFYATGSVSAGASYGNGVVVGGVIYPSGTVTGGVIYPTGAVSGGITYPTGTVIGSLVFHQNFAQN
ncbi:hypothetical protein [Geomesophilobacter sediminis]|uniref:Fibronectin type-III domain-containing protein n=1 Tax=Geomesophilobacter sediminis TaxID=2798584 RepID=A0A8J7S8Y0_9BACT|nr:hypothetical protein [Geomesophilobacter sediminis]MBJ6727931.1 hypothetical protein [Geomesophilobacter sediminis]